MKKIVLGQMDNTQDHTFESSNRVYGSDGLCPTILTCGGGNSQPKKLEVNFYNDYKDVKCCAMRGRENLGGGQNLEIKKDCLMNALTTVQKGQMVMEITPSDVYIKQATKDGYIPCEIGGGGRLKLPQQQNPTRTRARERADLPNTNNGEYP